MIVPLYLLAAAAAGRLPNLPLTEGIILLVIPRGEVENPGPQRRIATPITRNPIRRICYGVVASPALASIGRRMAAGE
jgi:hypothetical protein